jgi:hypothetical protein
MTPKAQHPRKGPTGAQKENFELTNKGLGKSETLTTKLRKCLISISLKKQESSIATVTFSNTISSILLLLLSHPLFNNVTL